MTYLRQSLEEAYRNLANWRNRYSPQEYPHKIVVNMMYRAYSTRIVYQTFASGPMLEIDNVPEAFNYIMKFYGKVAMTKVRDNLEYWMETRPLEEVGTLNTARYEALATKAETNKKFQEELEFSYIFELLNDMSVLAFLAFRLTGESEVDAIAKMSGRIIEPLPYMDYTIAKQVFQQLVVTEFMSMNYKPLP